MNRFNSIEAVADYIINCFSFEYKTLSEGIKEVFYNGKKVIFDAFTMNIHFCELSIDEKKELFKDINLKYKLKKEIEKERKERIILDCFLDKKGYNNSLITKSVRPDFIIKNNIKKIGVEVTEFKSTDIAIQDKICKNVSGKKLTKEEIIEISKKTTLSMYRNYDYDSIDGHAVISSPLFDVNQHKIEFVKTIESKIIKYEKMVDDFDEFIILANAPDIEITSEFDIIDLLSKIRLKPSKTIKLCIIYDCENIKQLYECYLN